MSIAAAWPTATPSRAICPAAPRAASCRPSMADIPLDFGTLEPHGCFIGSPAVVILSDNDDMKAVALNLMRFFEDESCGQCTPCRVGTAKAAQLMARPWDAGLLAELSRVMRDASICGLGQAAPNPLDCVFKYFPKNCRSHWDVGNRRATAMSDGNGQKPVGYGHDNSKGAAGGPAYGDGKSGVAHTAPADTVAGKGEAATAKTFTIDDREIDIREGETIFRAARRLGIKLPHLCIRRNPAIGPTAIAASAWSRSRASACWRRAASVRPHPG